MSAYGMVSVDNHIERRNREWNPATELSPRQIEFVRAWAAMPGATLQAIADRLGITRATAAQHRDAAIAMGALGTSGYGKTRRVWLTAMGRRAIDAGKTATALRSGDQPVTDAGAAQGRAESSAGALAGLGEDSR